MTRRLFAIGLLSGILGLWDADAEGAPALPGPVYFSNRAVANPAIALRTELAAPASDYQHRIVAERCLLIRNPAIVDSVDFDSDPVSRSNPNPPWGFAQVIYRAFRTAGANLSQVEGFMQAWQSDQGLGGLDLRWKQPITQAPVRLLGVINRLDLAELKSRGVDRNDGAMCGAEVRFVYAALSSLQAGYLNLIVEFVLPCISKPAFHAYAARWNDLRTLPGPAPGSPYYRSLEWLLTEATGHANCVRLRVSMRNDNVWDVHQFAFQSKGLARQLLFRQPNVGKVSCDPRSLFSGFVQNNLPQILASQYSIPAPLGAQIERLSPILAALTLAPGIGGAYYERARYSLSINSCLGCHGIETGTQFNHLQYRRRGESSRLSNFLAGPSQDVVTDQPWSPGAPPLACVNGTHGDVRFFNDLVRRHLFLNIARRLDPAAPDVVWRRALDTTGLTALQTH